MDIDRIIKEKFTSSFMNDSKWDQLIETLTDKLDEIFINYKLIHDDKIYFTSFNSPDFRPFFIEPTFYKEVEWIEFPKTFKTEQNKRTTRKHFKGQNQDIDTIEKIINQIGKFIIEKEDQSIKLYAYR
jgi:hypothetical protein